MITATQALLLLETLAVSGLRAPDAYLRPAGDGVPSGKVLAAKAYAAGLNAAGVDYDAADAAVLAYLAEPDPGQYPKPWPDPGKLIARTAIGRAAGHLGSDADAEQAFALFQRRRAWFRGMNVQPNREVPELRFDDSNAYRDDAMFEAWKGWPQGGAEPDPVHGAFAFSRAREAWLKVYREARAGQRQDAAALRLTATTQRLIAVSP